MRPLAALYGHSLALLTDLYQLTMAYGYWKNGLAERECVFHLTFRSAPFEGRYAVACGLEHVVSLLDDLHFEPSDLNYLASLTGGDGQPLFESGFLGYLSGLDLRCDIDAIPEGTVVFPHEPLIRVRGQLAPAQIIETPLLNTINFQTLIATKAARVCSAARGDDVLEFGLRRAQGMDGGLAASRAAFVGGCSATSNLLAGRLFGIPVKGTHAHSWVMSFEDELDSFHAYARALPNNCVFLVDTYATLTGVARAIEVGRSLRARGHELAGVRLDSGDLVQLSIAARRMLDEAGFPNAAIVASNDLDEFEIERIKQHGGRVNVWGVGTRLATAYSQPALGGVYKLGALRDEGGTWRHKVKLSEQPLKVSDPGCLQVRRFRTRERLLADVVYDELTGIAEPVEATDPHSCEPLPLLAGAEGEDLLVPIFRGGTCVYQSPPLVEIRERAGAQWSQLDPAVTRLSDPRRYPVGTERNLYHLKRQLIAAARPETHQRENIAGHAPCN